MAAAAAENGAVCVTGGGGFIGSWVVHLLLSKGYLVHTTVRDPSDDAKYGHLKRLPNAVSGNPKLVKADLMDYPSLLSAFQGCSGVFHVASPCTSTFTADPQVEIVEPAVKGTLNVVEACLETKIKRVVVVSSTAAVNCNPKWPTTRAMDESSWSDTEFMKAAQIWYCLGKTEAERQALEYGKITGLDVVSICPDMTFGPLLQPTLNTSTSYLTNLLKEGYETYEDRHRMIVDVRDVAEAIVLVYEKPEAQGRYICCRGDLVTMREIVGMLKPIYPNFHYPNNFTEGHDGYEKQELSSQKLQKLGWRYRPLLETLVDSLESYKNAGFWL